MPPFKETLTLVMTVLGALVVFVTLGSAGFMVAQHSCEQTIKVLQEEKSSLQTKVADLEKKNDESQTRVTLLEAQKPDREKGTQASTATEGVKTTIEPGDTAQVYSGSLFITLVGISPEYDPLRYQVTASIGTQGKESARLDKVDPGSRVTYGDFEVRLLSADSNRATFLVQRGSAGTSPGQEAQSGQAGAGL